MPSEAPALRVECQKETCSSAPAGRRGPCRSRPEGLWPGPGLRPCPSCPPTPASLRTSRHSASGKKHRGRFPPWDRGHTGRLLGASSPTSSPGYATQDQWLRAELVSPGSHARVGVRAPGTSGCELIRRQTLYRGSRPKRGPQGGPSPHLAASSQGGEVRTQTRREGRWCPRPRRRPAQEGPGAPPSGPRGQHLDLGLPASRAAS